MGDGVNPLKIFPFAGDSSQLSFSPKEHSPQVIFSPLPSVIRERNFSFIYVLLFTGALNPFPLYLINLHILNPNSLHTIPRSPYLYGQFLTYTEIYATIKNREVLDSATFKNLPICAHSFSLSNHTVNPICIQSVTRSINTFLLTPAVWLLIFAVQAQYGSKSPWQSLQISFPLQEQQPVLSSFLTFIHLYQTSDGTCCPDSNHMSWAFFSNLKILCLIQSLPLPE